jgi:tetratricopeptide (TPR) repeat protein
MKIRKSTILILILFLSLAFGSCSKKLIPGLKSGKEYDLAAFNYLYVDAVRMKLLGNMGEALKYFEQCLILNPQSDATYYQMAQIVLGNGDLANGKNYIKKACDLQPGNLWYNMMLAGIYHQENNLDSAIICYERTVKAYPEKENLQVSLAKLYSQNRNYDKARNLLSRLDEKHGVNESTTLTLVDNLIAEANFKEAGEKIQQLLSRDPDNIVFNGYLAAIYRHEGKPEKAREVYNQLIERNPDNPAIQLSLCEFLLSEKNFSELFDLLNIVLINNKITKEEKVSLIAELIGNKDILRDHGDKMQLAVMVLEADYKNDDILALLRPELLQNMGKREEAALRLEEIINLNPENYYAWEKLLLVYYELKDFKKLQKKGGECSTKFNRSIIAKMLYATGAMENEDFTIALEELRKAGILAGDNKELKLQVLTMKADIHYRMKNYSEAFKSYDEALKMDNSDLTVMNNYAYYLAEQDMQLKDAEQMAKTVIEKEKGNNTFLDTYAWVLYKRGKAREAAKIMERIINSESGNDAEYFEHYGYILRKLGKCRDAVKNWEKAVVLDKEKTNLIKEIENCKK